MLRAQFLRVMSCPERGVATSVPSGCVQSGWELCGGSTVGAGVCSQNFFPFYPQSLLSLGGDVNNRTMYRVTACV